MTDAARDERPAYLLVQGKVTDREGKGTFFVTILDGRPAAG